MVEGQPEPNTNELDIEAGYELGRQETEEDVMERLADEGFDEDDIERLFDPAPRRGRSRHRRYRRAKMYDPDPAPRRRRSRSASAYPKKRRSRARGALNKLRPFIMPVTAGVTFYMAYTSRAKALGVNPDTGLPYTVFEAIMYDFKNFDSAAAWTRIQDKGIQPAIIAGAGWAVKKYAPGGGIAKMVGDAIMGLGVGQLVKVVLDPPVGGIRAGGPGRGMIMGSSQVIQARASGSAVPMRAAVQQPSNAGGYTM